jgi:hypothetical protein
MQHVYMSYVKNGKAIVVYYKSFNELHTASKYVDEFNNSFIGYDGKVQYHLDVPTAVSFPNLQYSNQVIIPNIIHPII